MDHTGQPERRQVLAGVAAGLASLSAGVGQTGGQSSEEVTVTLDNDGSFAWVLQSAEEDVGPTGVSNPGLTLTVGTRYRFENLGWSSHPLAFRDEADDPLLTQAGQGSFQDDDAVDWVDDGEELAFTVTEELAAEFDDYVCTVHSSMEGSLQAEGVDEGSPAFFETSNLTPTSATVEVGTSVNVEATVENTGDTEATKSVQLSVGGLSSSVSVTVAGGDFQRLSFTLDTTTLGPGEYSHTVSTEDDQVTGSLTVVPPPDPAEFEITEFSPTEATVTQGDPVELSATVQNVGDEESTDDISLALSGAGEIAAQTRTLGAGGVDTVTFTVSTNTLAAGEYTHTVSTATDSVEGSLLVEAPPEPAAFEIVELSPPEVTATQGDTVSLDVTVQNVGDEGGSQAVALELSGVGPVGGDSVFLDGGESESVGLTVDTTDLEPGEYTATVSTRDNSTQGVLTVEAPPTLEITELNTAAETITQGEAFVVEATVQNVGDSEGDLVATLELDTLGQADSEALTLTSGESASVTLTAPGDLFQPGEYGYTVSSFTDELTGSLTVEAPDPEDDSTGDDGGNATDDADGSGPGFGPLGGVAAIGGLAAYAYRKLGTDERDET